MFGETRSCNLELNNRVGSAATDALDPGIGALLPNPFTCSVIRLRCSGIIRCGWRSSLDGWVAGQLEIPCGVEWDFLVQALHRSSATGHRAEHKSPPKFQDFADQRVCLPCPGFGCLSMPRLTFFPHPYHHDSMLLCTCDPARMHPAFLR